MCEEIMRSAKRLAFVLVAIMATLWLTQIISPTVKNALQSSGRMNSSTSSKGQFENNLNSLSTLPPRTDGETSSPSLSRVPQFEVVDEVKDGVYTNYTHRFRIKFPENRLRYLHYANRMYWVYAPGHSINLSEGVSLEINHAKFDLRDMGTTSLFTEQLFEKEIGDIVKFDNSIARVTKRNTNPHYRWLLFDLTDDPDVESDFRHTHSYWFEVNKNHYYNLTVMFYTSDKKLIQESSDIFNSMIESIEVIGT